MNKLVNVGLVGFGMAGRIFHAPTISCVPGLRLKKIRQTNAANLPLINSRYPGTEVVPAATDIFSDADIELVVIGSPNATHYSLAKEALLAGKHVVVDKPFTVTVAEAEELAALARSRNLLLSVYQNRRWDSDFLTVQKVLQSGLLGRLAECEIHYDRFRNTLRPNTWKEAGDQGTGLLYDLGSHLIDQALTLFGLPEAVSADLRTQRPETKIIDNFELVLDYGNLKVTLKSGFLVKEPLPKYILLGEQGSFVKYGLDVQEEALNGGLSPATTPNWGQEPESTWGTLHTEYNGVEFRGKVKSEAGNYVAYYENILRALQGSEELRVKAEDGVNVIRIIERAFQSQAEKRWVRF
ncbi:oxidoreductase [Paraflavisolibacter sp. H34]|uniref:oxidoreductase n=1 Tax=Huijunlia imazamoxiresistens TaxID=3127457 RepID=UPI0030162F42